MATNRVHAHGNELSLTCSHPTSPDSGQPCRIGALTAVATADEATDGTTPVQFDGVWDLPVKGVDDDGNVAVAAGNPVFYVDADIDDGTGFLSKKVSGYFFGVALEAVNSGSTTTIKVKQIDGVGPGTADLLGEALTLAKMADLARGSVIVGGASNRPTAVDAKTSGRILVGDGTDLASVAVSGDVTLSSAGAVAIGAGKVTGEMLDTGIFQADLLAGADETMTPNYTLAAMAATSELVFVGQIATAASIATLADKTADFTAGAGVLTRSANAVDNTGNQLLVFWVDHTTA